MNYRAHHATLTSPFRTENEDSVLIERGDGYILAAVFDGMGGRDHGRLAARIGLASLCRHDATLLDRDVLCRALVDAHRDMREESDRLGLARSMGATATIAVIDNHRSRLLVAHIGDSRAYLGRHDHLLQLSVDAVTADLRALPESERRASPRNHVLTAALGAVDGDITRWIQFRETELQPGDVVLLCTDGLSDHLGHGRIAYNVSVHGREPEALVDTLLTQAQDAQLCAGRGDNISAAAIAVVANVFEQGGMAD